MCRAISKGGREKTAADGSSYVAFTPFLIDFQAVYALGCQFWVLKADRSCGWTNADIASAYEVSTKKVEQLKKRFVEDGFEAALYRKPVTNAHRRKITGDEEAHLIALYCRQAPEGHERWTLRMLADKMVELDIIASVSHETIRRTLKKMNLNRGKRKNGVFRQNKMPPLSVTWKKS